MYKNVQLHIIMCINIEEEASIIKFRSRNKNLNLHKYPRNLLINIDVNKSLFFKLC